MSVTNTYQIAETNELEELGRDEMELDTSAGISPGEHVPQEEYEAETKSFCRPRLCIALIVIAFLLGIGATVLGVLLSRNGDDAKPSPNSPTPANGSPQPAMPPPSQPAAPKPTVVAVTTVPPATAATTSSNAVRKHSVNVISRTPHDRMAFTQGFEYAYGFFYESTGLRGQTSLRKVDILTGKVIQKHEFPDMTLFGEGMTLHTTHHIFMLTWQAGRGFVFNQTTLDVIKEWKYDGEGWGLCMDREKDEVYMSDGTSDLRVLDPEDLSEKRRITVTLRGKNVSKLNEIEWVCGEVWSNVWMTKHIYRIDPTTGKVKAIIDASNLPLKEDAKPENDVLNGIAFDKETGRLWLTGKKWPVVYQVKVSDDSLDLTNCK